MIDIAGAGAFGTAMALALHRAGHTVTLWSRRLPPERCSPTLPDYPIPDAIRLTDNPGDLTADVLLVAVPTQAIADAVATLRPRHGTLVSCAKGLDMGSGQGPTARLAAARPDAECAQLTGPAFAIDLAAGLPIAMVLAARTGAEALQRRLAGPQVRLYTTTDVIGAEMGGALKNVVAIGCGAVDGAGLGESARAALLTRGFAEMRRLAEAAGAAPDTLAGLSGLGDLVLTATSPRSRNYRLGLALGRGEAPPAETQEGLYTAQRLAAETRGDTPVLDAVVALAAGRAGVTDLADTLLTRPLKPE